MTREGRNKVRGHSADEPAWFRAAASTARTPRPPGSRLSPARNSRNCPAADAASPARLRCYSDVLNGFRYALRNADRIMGLVETRGRHDARLGGTIGNGVYFAWRDHPNTLDCR